MFAGYCVLRPWVVQGKSVATIDREVHPDWEKPRFEYAGGVCNSTSFSLTVPQLADETNWNVCGFAIDGDAIDQVVQFLDPITREGPHYPYAYCRHFERPYDNLELLGYEVTDGIFCCTLSLMYGMDFSRDELEALGGCKLNEYGLFADVVHAATFVRKIQANDPDEPHFELPVVLQVWGKTKPFA